MLTVPLPFCTVHTWRGLLGWLLTATSYGWPAEAEPGNVKLPLADTGTLALAWYAAAEAVPPIVNVGAAGGGGGSSSRIVTEAWRCLPSVPHWG